jgi:hypothetical protein
MSEHEALKHAAQCSKRSGHVMYVTVISGEYIVNDQPLKADDIRVFCPRKA